MWIFAIGGKDHFTHNSVKLVGYAEYNRTLRCVGGATYTIVGTGSPETHLQSRFGGWWLLSAFFRCDTCQVSPTTYCRYG